jgi:hypothetical protein
LPTGAVGAGEIEIIIHFTNTALPTDTSWAKMSFSVLFVAAMISPYPWVVVRLTVKVIRTVSEVTPTGTANELQSVCHRAINEAIGTDSGSSVIGIFTIELHAKFCVYIHRQTVEQLDDVCRYSPKHIPGSVKGR